MDEQKSAVIARLSGLQAFPLGDGYLGRDLTERDGAPTKGRGHASIPGSAAPVTRHLGAHLLG